MAEKDGLDRIPVNVTITLVNGQRVKGAIGVTRGRNLGEMLNSGGQFVLMEAEDGLPTYLALSSILEIKSSQMPDADQLKRARASIDESNPYRILRVDENCDRERLKAAYHELAKIYHPDQYSNVFLPQEVRSYITSIAKRINMAYSELDTDLKLKEAEKLVRQAREAQFRPARKFGV